MLKVISIETRYHTFIACVEDHMCTYFFLKGKRTSKKSINFFLKFEKEYLEASNIMYFLPSEYVSIRKYGHLKFRYSWHHRHISTLQLIVYCVDYVKKHSVLHHWALFLYFQKVVCKAGNKGILIIFFLILISSPYFLALEKKKKFFPKLRFPLKRLNKAFIVYLQVSKYRINIYIKSSHIKYEKRITLTVNLLTPRSLSIK